MNLKNENAPMSLFGRYIKERNNKDIVEDDDGFATFYFMPDGQCYIEDLYIIPELRGDPGNGIGPGARYANKIVEIAKLRGSTKIYGSVVPSLPNATKNIQTLFKYGFTVKSSTPDMIFFEKEIL